MLQISGVQAVPTHAPWVSAAEVHACIRPAALTPVATPGNFFSAAFENSCLAVAGASGGIFGMIGLYIADMILNFESIKRCVNDRVCIYAPRCHFAGGGCGLLADTT